METRQQQDLELWRKWKKTHSTKDLEILMDRLHPLLMREVNKWKGSVPVEALETEAKLLVVAALQDYNPSKGAAIGTHITSRLRKLSRSVYTQQNVVRLPENKQLMYNTYNIAHVNLTEKLGREPTILELRDETGWSKKHIAGLQTDYNRKQYTESDGIFGDTHKEDDNITYFYHSTLAPQDQKLFESITGFGGAKTLKNTELKRKFKMTQGQISHRKNKFVKDLKRIQRGEF